MPSNLVLVVPLLLPADVVLLVPLLLPADVVPLLPTLLLLVRRSRKNPSTTLRAMLGSRVRATIASYWVCRALMRSPTKPTASDAACAMGASAVAVRPSAGRSLEIVSLQQPASAADLLMRTVNHVAVAAAASAAAHVGRAWSATLSGASNRLQRKTPSVAGVVIYTEGRNGQDRSLAATLQRLSAFLPTISFASLAGFNGVGRRIGNEPVNEAEDLRNVSVVLDAVTGALQQLDVETFHAGAHVFEDWAMDEDAYMHAAPQRFCEEDVEEEKAHYTKSIAAGMLGCTTSHFLAWASFAQQGLSPYDSADCVSTVTPLRLLG